MTRLSKLLTLIALAAITLAACGGQQATPPPSGGGGATGNRRVKFRAAWAFRALVPLLLPQGTARLRRYVMRCRAGKGPEPHLEPERPRP